MYFSAAASSENDQGSMNLASNTASVPSTMPSRVAAIQGMAECLTRRWTSVTRRPVLRSYQVRLSSSVAVPSCTMRLPDRSSGSASPRFSRQRRTRAASSLPMMIRASEPPMKERRSVALHPKKRDIFFSFEKLIREVLSRQCIAESIPQVLNNPKGIVSMGQAPSQASSFALPGPSCAGSSATWRMLPRSHFRPSSVSKLGPEFWRPHGSTGSAQTSFGERRS